MLHRGRHAVEVAHRAHARVEVELLAHRDVERAEPAADRRAERPLDRHQMVGDRAQGVVGKPAVEAVLRLLAGENLEPHDPPFAAVGFSHRGVEDVLGRAPDIGPRTIALDERDDGLGRHV
jgi:hypothetical protein